MIMHVKVTQRTLRFNERDQRRIASMQCIQRSANYIILYFNTE